MTLHLDHLIPLRDAAKLFGLSESRLHDLVKAGKIKGAILPGGEIGVSETAAITALNEKLQTIKREKFAHIKGQPITVTDASSKYNVNRRTLLRWVDKKYIAVIQPGYQMILDEGDVAYCAQIYHARTMSGVTSGAPLLADDSTPYLLKLPNLSEYRRRKKV